MKKKILFIILLIFLTGCTTKYEVVFNGDSFKEKIDINIPNEYLSYGESNVEGIESDNQLESFLNEDQYPIADEYEYKYDKDVKRKGNYTNVKMKFKYTVEQYKNSNVFKKCFESKKISESRTGYSINAYGNFYCLYGDKLEINIKTDRKVIKHNADKVSGNTYTWIIDDTNVKSTNIIFDISKKYNATSNILTIIGIVIGIIVLAAGIFVYVTLKNRDKVNEI